MAINLKGSWLIKSERERGGKGEGGTYIYIYIYIYIYKWYKRKHNMLLCIYDIRFYQLESSLDFNMAICHVKLGK